MPKPRTENISISRLSELYVYDRLKGEIRNRVNNRKVLPHPDEGYVVCYDPETRLRKKLLYRNLAYVLGNLEFVPIKHKVLTLDLDDENIKFHNLKLLKQSTYWDIKVALRNLLGELKIAQHHSDKHAYKVQWVTRNQHREITTYDMGAAEKFKSQKELEFTKVVNQHIRSV